MEMFYLFLSGDDGYRACYYPYNNMMALPGNKNIAYTMVLKYFVDVG